MSTIMNVVVDSIINNWMERGVIREEDKDVYQYGLEQMILKVLNVITTVIIGICFGCLVETLIFFIAFILLRKNAGGYHATTRLRCYTVSTLSTALCVWLIGNAAGWNYKYWIAYLIIGMIICMCSPVDAHDKPLDDIEKNVYGIRARIIWGIETMIGVILYMLGLHAWVIAILVAHLLLVMSLVAGMVKNVGEKGGEN